MTLLPLPEPVAWADDAAAQGRVGNCSSTTAKQYWALSNWVDKSRAERLKHPLFTADQLRAYAAQAVAQAVERCAKQLDALGCDHCAAAIRATPQHLQE